MLLMKMTTKSLLLAVVAMLTSWSTTVCLLACLCAQVSLLVACPQHPCFADGLGYADDGEEDYSDVSDDETRAINKRIRAEEEAADVRQKKKRAGFVEQSTKITSLFLKPAAVLGPAAESSKPAAGAR
jgi:hypothetical protein